MTFSCDSPEHNATGRAWFAALSDAMAGSLNPNGTASAQGSCDGGPTRRPGNAPSISCPAGRAQCSVSASRTNKHAIDRSELGRQSPQARTHPPSRTIEDRWSGMANQNLRWKSLSFRPCGPPRSGRSASCCLSLCRSLAASPRYLSLIPISAGPLRDRCGRPVVEFLLRWLRTRLLLHQLNSTAAPEFLLRNDPARPLR
jgi:hypothetical protein